MQAIAGVEHMLNAYVLFRDIFVHTAESDGECVCVCVCVCVCAPTRFLIVAPHVA